MKRIATEGYKEFKLNNRIKVNRYLNFVLWFFAIAGPAIALGIKSGVFHDITYKTCIGITAVVIVLSAIHLVMLKMIPKSAATGIFALTSLNALLVYMAVSNVSIYITWFLVPLLSLLFCDKFTFIYVVSLNTVLMTATTIFTAPYHVSLRSDYSEVGAYLADVLGGFAIETLVMIAAGIIILKLTTEYYTELFSQNTLISEQQRSVEEKMEILDSMAEIYDHVNLIDFVENTEMSLRDPEQKKHYIDMPKQTHTLMNQRLKNNVMPYHLDAFLNFTNITTVRARLTGKKLISADFIDVISGWFRAQYITVDATPDGIPNYVIYTIRNVDEEKRREEHLVRIAMTDEMTRLFNRRSYEEDLADYRGCTLSDDFVLFSVDINGLKSVNDRKGHVAGDELIKGAADCLALSIGNNGKAYRTGGDEFIAVACTENPEEIRALIAKKTGEWHGIFSDEISMSVGYAAAKDHPGATIDELERAADADMYAEKEKYYKEKGINRRR